MWPMRLKSRAHGLAGEARGRKKNIPGTRPVPGMCLSLVTRALLQLVTADVYLLIRSEANAAASEDAAPTTRPAVETSA